jgi:hypothetical protein
MQSLLFRFEQIFEELKEKVDFKFDFKRNFFYYKWLKKSKKNAKYLQNDLKKSNFLYNAFS